MRIEFSLLYPPLTGNHTTRRGHGKTYTDAAIVTWRGLVANAVAKVGAAQMLPGPLTLEVWASPPDDRARDADNLLKVLGDALTRGRVWTDDSNKVIRKTTLEWFEKTPCGTINVIIETID